MERVSRAIQVTATPGQRRCNCEEQHLKALETAAPGHLGAVNSDAGCLPYENK